MVQQKGPPLTKKTLCGLAITVLSATTALLSAPTTVLAQDADQIARDLSKI